jgi:hypothetical protein
MQHGTEAADSFRGLFKNHPIKILKSLYPSIQGMRPTAINIAYLRHAEREGYPRSYQYQVPPAPFPMRIHSAVCKSRMQQAGMLAEYMINEYMIAE